MANDVDYAIVADIGGTNARFSRVNLTSLNLDKVAVYPCATFASLADALVHYQQEQALTDLKHVAIAIACPVTSDTISMTNFHWHFSVSAMQQQLGLNRLLVMNDFTAVAMSLPALTKGDKVQIGNGTAQPHLPMAVLGAGTGLGVAHLINVNGQFVPLPGEGGHVDWAAQTEQEWFIQQVLCKEYGHVSPERLLSGPGLEAIYRALALHRQLDIAPLSAGEIGSLALAGSSELASATVAQFFASLGSIAGDLALTLSTFGGVYVAGGITPKLLPLMAASEFRTRFEAKGRFSAFNRQIATYIVTAPQPGLLGAAVYLKQSLAS
ncbi:MULTISPECIES: glucokinase [unclassified Arsukibacterium]|uniref:glucokinase n=1 Tax=unclassified Arsukibacterium TaxID=2635278 RepID=UPI000C5F7C72|nr:MULTISPECIES: glucokinase [unclassified Arsukibacterium]MAA93884.1 glucokinase [Rheinheimera sp.]MBM33335.1 glucokinase [Rheinheimera sp.]HAW94116.1 glucokinase [Candidatus Azambacteria bacterium]|tara:strand:- start:77761 stop:78732 length:972 start_codon:yes stop_codon:yes gene_type:complete